MILLIAFLQVLAFALFASGCSYLIFNEMDDNGLLGWWQRIRDTRWPVNEQGKMTFIGAITGQCPYCMNIWLTGIVFVVITALWCDYLNMFEYWYRFLFILPVAVFSNLFLTAYFRLFGE